MFWACLHRQGIQVTGRIGKLVRVGQITPRDFKLSYSPASIPSSSRYTCSLCSHSRGAQPWMAQGEAGSLYGAPG